MGNLYAGYIIISKTPVWKFICIEVDRSEPGREHIAATKDFSSPRLYIHPGDLELSQDSAEERKAVKEKLQPIRDSYQHDGVQVMSRETINQLSGG